MKAFDPKSRELEQLEDMEEDQLREELGRCPGPVDLFSHNVSRKGFMKVGLGGLLSKMFTQWLDPRMASAMDDVKTGKAKACILLWMNGGPSHLETFDPKPDTPTGGPTKAIKTRIQGVQISENLPHLADVESACYAEEFAYWPKASVRRGRG